MLDTWELHRSDTQALYLLSMSVDFRYCNMQGPYRSVFLVLFLFKETFFGNSCLPHVRKKFLAEYLNAFGDAN